MSFYLCVQGIVPLGGCSIEVTSEPNHPFAIQIHGDDLGVNIYLCVTNMQFWVLHGPKLYIYNIMVGVESSSGVGRIKLRERQVDIKATRSF